MAIAKTPKNTSAASSAAAPKLSPTARAAVVKPAAPKSAEAKAPLVRPHAVKPPVAKPVAARAAAAKSAEDAVVHSAEVAPKIAAEQATKAADTVVKTADAVTKTVDKVAEKAADTVTKTVTKVADTVPEVVAKPALALPVAVKAAKTVEDSVMRGVGPLIDFGRENAILMVSAGNELALGLHKMSLSMLDWSAESCDKGVAASQAILTAKSVEEVIGLSQSLAQDSLQQILKESSELGKLSRKLIEETIVPLPGRMVAAVEKLAAHAA